MIDDRVQQHGRWRKCTWDGDCEDMDAKLQEVWDDVSSVLDSKEVRRATFKEIQYIEDEKVWRRIFRQGELRNSAPSTRS